MILDTLAASAAYEPLHPGLARAFAYLRNLSAEDLAQARCDIEGNSIYAMVQTYRTEDRERLQLKTHRRYIDVQYIVKGCEAMGWRAAQTLEKAPYDEGKDLTLYPIGERPTATVEVREGEFALFFPEDAHLPKGAPSQGPQEVLKIVVKVRV